MKTQERELLMETEIVHKVLLCASLLISRGLASSFPGLNAAFSLKLRGMGIDPEAGLLANPESYLKTLLELLGGGRAAEALLRSALPRKEVFDKILEALLTSRSAAELEVSLLSIAREYGKDLRAVCKDVY